MKIAKNLDPQQGLKVFSVGLVIYERIPAYLD